MSIVPASALTMTDSANEERPDSSSQETSSGTSHSSYGLRSEVWKFFVKEDGAKSATCKLCKKPYAYRGGTSNLRDHLTRAHPDEFNPAAKQQQPSLNSFLTRSKCSDSRAKRITDLIADMVARDLRPCAMVEGDGFLALMKYVEPGYKVPSGMHIAKIVRQKHEAGKLCLKERLQVDATKFAVTSDIWTSCTQDAYISITAHFITTSWQMVSCVLATSPFPDHHTAINIVEKLKQIVGSYGVDVDKGRLIALVHDQGSNMQLTGEMLEEEIGCESLSCAAHRLQLCVEKGLSIGAITRAVGAAKKLVGHFRHSALATSELRKRQESMGIPQKKLQQDCPTRWNSTFYMIRSLLENRWPVIAVLSDETVTKRQYRYLDLSSDNWVILEDLTEVLEPLEVATVFLSKETNVSLSSVLPVVNGLVSKLATTANDSHIILEFKTKVVADLKQRWKLDELDTDGLSVLATALDPRFRQLKFLSNEQRSEVKEELLRRASATEKANGSATSVDPPAPKRAKSAFDILLGEEEDTVASNDTCDAQLAQFFVEKAAPHSTNPIDWWRQNEFRFPQLAEVARSVLCVPATSTPSERLFSTAGLTVTKLRNCLKPDNVDALVFLNKNFEYLSQ